MGKIGLFYGSSTGDTKDAIKRVAFELRTRTTAQMDQIIGEFSLDRRIAREGI